MRVQFIILILIHSLTSLLIAAPEPKLEPSTLRTGNQKSKFAKARKKVPNEYIVVLNQATTETDHTRIADKLAHRHDAEIFKYYRHAIKGFAARMSESAALKLSESDEVDYVEENDQIDTTGVQTNPGNWGLDRIDQRLLPLNKTYSFANTGQGVTAYVIDTGLNVLHKEFSGRIIDIKDFVHGDPDHYQGYYGQDCVGHGTHVAGILGGTTYGVAKGVYLFPIRVGEVQDCLDPTRPRLGVSNATLIEALDWLLVNHRKPAVVNISLYDYDGDEGLDAAVKELIRAGLTVVAGVGNQVGDVGGSPARVWEVISVAPSDAIDRRVHQSEAGPAVDVFAPGATILSAWYHDSTSVEYSTGSSMATPHVSGAVALFLQRNPFATPAQVHQFITRSATPGVVKNVPVGVPNRMLFVQP